MQKGKKKGELWAEYVRSATGITSVAAAAAVSAASTLAGVGTEAATDETQQQHEARGWG